MSAPLIRVKDFETSGMEPPAEVIELGWCDLVRTDDGWTVGDPASVLFGTAQPLEPGARAAHHITRAEIAGRTPFGPQGMWDAAADDGVSVVAAHNADFEGKYWGPPTLPVLCTYKAALRVWPDAPSHSNGALRYWLEDQGLISPDHALTQPAHRAGPDAYVTAHILKALLAHATAAEMVAWTRLPRLMPRINFGKHKGEWSEAPADYLDWVVRKSELDADTKWNAQREIDRRREARA